MPQRYSPYAMDTPDLARIAELEMKPTASSRCLRPRPCTRPTARAGRPAAPGDIRDLRARLWFSIDNDDTLDLDQLSWAEALPGGGVRLAVAVADVDAKVRARWRVDAHAAVNTTSVYTAAGVFAMLPLLLSNGLTSLHEGEERLAVVVEMEVDPGRSHRLAALPRFGAQPGQARLRQRGGLAGRAGAAAARGRPVRRCKRRLHLHDQVALSCGNGGTGAAR